MTAFLPPEWLELFAPRDPIPYMPPVEKLSHEKKRQPYTGVGSFDGFEDPKDTPPPTHIETRLEHLERKRQEKADKAAYKLEQDIASFDPHNISDGTTDPLKTLFVAKIGSDTTESRLRRQFEVYGSIKKIVMVPDKKSGKPRGYAFIEYEHERDMKTAYKKSEDLKIDGNRVIVDVERSRTVKGWLPKRLGGGISEKSSTEGNGRHSGRDVASRHDSRERDRSRSRSREKERRRSDSNRPKDHRRDRELRDDKKEVQRQIRERRRSRSRDRKRARRSKSRDRERERRRHGDYDRDRKPRVLDGIVIKTEPTSDNDSRGDYSNSN